jgi:P27 family predicted phage terminase small subunit
MRTGRAVDATSLAAYCEAVARLRAATAWVVRVGLMHSPKNDPSDIRKNPAVAQARDASNEVRLWAREFGLTPSSRQPLRIEHTHRDLPAERLLS